MEFEVKTFWADVWLLDVAGGRKIYLSLSLSCTYFVDIEMFGLRWAGWDET